MTGLFPQPTGPRSDAPWDLSFLRLGAAVAGSTAAVAAVAVGFLLTWADAVGVVVGAAVVTAFFCLSGLVIAWAGKRDDSFTLPAALGTFVLKAFGLYVLLAALPQDGWLDRHTLAWTVVVGALLWSGVQLRWVWTRQLYYVTPPAPPRPVAPPGEAAVRPGLPADRETRSTSG